MTAGGRRDGPVPTGASAPQMVAGSGCSREASGPALRLDRAFVVLDYDNTVTAQDCNDLLLQETTGDAWLPSEHAMIRGELSRTAAFRIQFGLIHVPRRRLLDIVVGVATLREGFADFLRAIVSQGARVAVVSDGLREAIESVWRREQLPPVEIYASELLGDAHGGYDLGFHPLALACPRCEVCKGTIVERVRDGARKVAVFGDGDGDLCMAEAADVVFARGGLQDACRRQGIDYVPFEAFIGLAGILESRL